VLDGDHKALVDAALPVCARYGLAVAGGYAVKAHGLVERPSEDIDFATGTTAPIEEIVPHWLPPTARQASRFRSLTLEGGRGTCWSRFPSAGLIALTC
jgi:hypothetical protein